MTLGWINGIIRQSSAILARSCEAGQPEGASDQYQKYRVRQVRSGTVWREPVFLPSDTESETAAYKLK